MTDSSKSALAHLIHARHWVVPEHVRVAYADPANAALVPSVHLIGIEGQVGAFVPGPIVNGQVVAFFDIMSGQCVVGDEEAIRRARASTLGLDRRSQFATKHEETFNKLVAAMCGPRGPRMDRGEFGTLSKAYADEVQRRSNMLGSAVPAEGGLWHIGQVFSLQPFLFVDDLTNGNRVVVESWDRVLSWVESDSTRFFEAVYAVDMVQRLGAVENARLFHSIDERVRAAQRAAAAAVEALATVAGATREPGDCGVGDRVREQAELGGGGEGGEETAARALLRQIASAQPVVSAVSEKAGPGGMGPPAAGTTLSTRVRSTQVTTTGRGTQVLTSSKDFYYLPTWYARLGRNSYVDLMHVYQLLMLHRDPVSVVEAVANSVVVGPGKNIELERERISTSRSGAAIALVQRLSGGAAASGVIAASAAASVARSQSRPGASSSLRLLDANAIARHGHLLTGRNLPMHQLMQRARACVDIESRPASMTAPRLYETSARSVADLSVGAGHGQSHQLQRVAPSLGWRGGATTETVRMTAAAASSVQGGRGLLALSQLFASSQHGPREWGPGREGVSASDVGEDVDILQELSAVAQLHAGSTSVADIASDLSNAYENTGLWKYVTMSDIKRSVGNYNRDVLPCPYAYWPLGTTDSGNLGDPIVPFRVVKGCMRYVLFNKWKEAPPPPPPPAAPLAAAAASLEPSEEGSDVAGGQGRGAGPGLRRSDDTTSALGGEEGTSVMSEGAFAQGRTAEFSRDRYDDRGTCEKTVDLSDQMVLLRPWWSAFGLVIPSHPGAVAIHQREREKQMATSSSSSSSSSSSDDAARQLLGREPPPAATPPLPPSMEEEDAAAEAPGASAKTSAGANVMSIVKVVVVRNPAHEDVQEQLLAVDGSAAGVDGYRARMARPYMACLSKTEMNASFFIPHEKSQVKLTLIGTTAGLHRHIALLYLSKTAREDINKAVNTVQMCTPPMTPSGHASESKCVNQSVPLFAMCSPPGMGTQAPPPPAPFMALRMVPVSVSFADKVKQLRLRTRGQKERAHAWAADRNSTRYMAHLAYETALAMFDSEISGACDPLYGSRFSWTRGATNKGYAKFVSAGVRGASGGDSPASSSRRPSPGMDVVVPKTEKGGGAIAMVMLERDALERRHDFEFMSEILMPLLHGHNEGGGRVRHVLPVQWWTGKNEQARWSETFREMHDMQRVPVYFERKMESQKETIIKLREIESEQGAGGAATAAARPGGEAKEGGRAAARRHDDAEWWRSEMKRTYTRQLVRDVDEDVDVYEYDGRQYQTSQSMLRRRSFVGRFWMRVPMHMVQLGSEDDLRIAEATEAMLRSNAHDASSYARERQVASGGVHSLCSSLFSDVLMTSTALAVPVYALHHAVSRWSTNEWRDGKRWYSRNVAIQAYRRGVLSRDSVKRRLGVTDEELDDVVAASHVDDDPTRIRCLGGKCSCSVSDGKCHALAVACVVAVRERVQTIVRHVRRQRHAMGADESDVVERESVRQTLGDAAVMLMPTSRGDGASAEDGDRGGGGGGGGDAGAGVLDVELLKRFAAACLDLACRSAAWDLYPGGHGTGPVSINSQSHTVRQEMEIAWTQIRDVSIGAARAHLRGAYPRPGPASGADVRGVEYATRFHDHPRAAARDSGAAHTLHVDPSIMLAAAAIAGGGGVRDDNFNLAMDAKIVGEVPLHNVSDLRPSVRLWDNAPVVLTACNSAAWAPTSAMLRYQLILGVSVYMHPMLPVYHQVIQREPIEPMPRDLDVLRGRMISPSGDAEQQSVLNPLLFDDAAWSAEVNSALTRFMQDMSARSGVANIVASMQSHKFRLLRIEKLKGVNSARLGIPNTGVEMDSAHMQQEDAKFMETVTESGERKLIEKQITVIKLGSAGFAHSAAVQRLMERLRLKSASLRKRRRAAALRPLRAGDARRRRVGRTQQGRGTTSGSEDDDLRVEEEREEEGGSAVEEERDESDSESSTVSGAVFEESEANDASDSNAGRGDIGGMVETGGGGAVDDEEEDEEEEEKGAEAEGEGEQEEDEEEEEEDEEEEEGEDERDEQARGVQRRGTVRRGDVDMSGRVRGSGKVNASRAKGFAIHPEMEIVSLRLGTLGSADDDGTEPSAPDSIALIAAMCQAFAEMGKLARTQLVPAHTRERQAATDATAVASTPAAGVPAAGEKNVWDDVRMISRVRAEYARALTAYYRTTQRVATSYVEGELKFSELAGMVLAEIEVRHFVDVQEDMRKHGHSIVQPMDVESIGLLHVTYAGPLEIIAAAEKVDKGAWQRLNAMAKETERKVAESESRLAQLGRRNGGATGARMEEEEGAERKEDEAGAAGVSGSGRESDESRVQLEADKNVERLLAASRVSGKKPVPSGFFGGARNPPRIPLFRTRASHQQEKQELEKLKNTLAILNKAMRLARSSSEAVRSDAMAQWMASGVRIRAREPQPGSVTVVVRQYVREDYTSRPVGSSTESHKWEQSVPVGKFYPTMRSRGRASSVGPDAVYVSVIVDSPVRQSSPLHLPLTTTYDVRVWNERGGIHVDADTEDKRIASLVRKQLETPMTEKERRMYARNNLDFGISEIITRRLESVKRTDADTKKLLSRIVKFHVQLNKKERLWRPLAHTMRLASDSPDDEWMPVTQAQASRGTAAGGKREDSSRSRLHVLLSPGVSTLVVVAPKEFEDDYDEEEDEGEEEEGAEEGAGAREENFGFDATAGSGAAFAQQEGRVSALRQRQLELQKYLTALNPRTISPYGEEYDNLKYSSLEMMTWAKTVWENLTAIPPQLAERVLEYIRNSASTGRYAGADTLTASDATLPVHAQGHSKFSIMNLQAVGPAFLPILKSALKELPPLLFNSVMGQLFRTDANATWRLRSGAFVPRATCISPRVKTNEYDGYALLLFATYYSAAVADFGNDVHMTPPLTAVAERQILKRMDRMIACGREQNANFNLPAPNMAMLRQACRFAMDWMAVQTAVVMSPHSAHLMRQDETVPKRGKQTGTYMYMLWSPIYSPVGVPTGTGAGTRISYLARQHALVTQIGMGEYSYKTVSDVRMPKSYQHRVEERSARAPRMEVARQTAKQLLAEAESRVGASAAADDADRGVAVQAHAEQSARELREEAYKQLQTIYPELGRLGAEERENRVRRLYEEVRRQSRRTQHQVVQEDLGDAAEDRLRAVIDVMDAGQQRELHRWLEVTEIVNRTNELIRSGVVTTGVRTRGVPVVLQPIDVDREEHMRRLEAGPAGVYLPTAARHAMGSETAEEANTLFRARGASIFTGARSSLGGYGFSRALTDQDMYHVLQRQFGGQVDPAVYAAATQGYEMRAVGANDTYRIPSHLQFAIARQRQEQERGTRRYIFPSTMSRVIVGAMR